jgi:hypothetical protein
MSTGYRNEMLEELKDEEVVSSDNSKNDFSGKVTHCSQFQAKNYLYQSGFRGISNNQQMQRLFRFALAAYDSGMFVGCGMVFLDISSPVVAFAVISTKDVAVGGKILRSIEEICKIMCFEELKLTNKGLTVEFIRNSIADRSETERYIEGKGCYVKRLS